MSWSNVKLIFYREVRDQLRDRRTLFMIFVLPLLLYPLLGMSVFQMTQFLRESASRVLVVGYETPPGVSGLIDKDKFSPTLLREWQSSQLFDLRLQTPAELMGLEKGAPAPTPEAVQAEARRLVDDGRYELVVYFSPDFSPRLEQLTGSVQQRAGPQPPVEVPAPKLFYDSSKEKSKMAFTRVDSLLGRWVEKLGQDNIARAGLTPASAKPFVVDEVNSAPPEQRDSALWAKMLPMVLLLWALTGAFYPAVDLCAGEKERGTLETLLTSPALRTEIVMGKLLTVMTFSIATASLNLLSMGITGRFVMNQLSFMSHSVPSAMPPLSSLIWLFIALIPMAALFGALCIALATFARSTKEGQYYLMPLILVTMPLVIFPMAPGVELTLGNSLIPVTGVVLLLRTLVEGAYLEALPYVLPVTLVTLGCCYLSIRWAVDQFNEEGVLFRDTERLNMSVWLRHLVRDRGDTPNAAEGVFCGVLILTIQFFISLAIRPPASFRDFAMLVFISQAVVILTPALLMTIMLTRKRLKTLLLFRPKLSMVIAAALLAVVLHPLHNLLLEQVLNLYPLGPTAKLQSEYVSKLLAQAPSPWLVVLLVAALPAVCEELAFRGFILMGLRQSGHRWRAILVSAIFFGLTHSILQQSIPAVFMGVLLAYIAIQTGSIWPGVVLHATHNAISTLHAEFPAFLKQHADTLGWLATAGENEFSWRWPAVLISAVGSAAIIYWFARQPHFVTPEEAVTESIQTGSTKMLGR